MKFGSGDTPQGITHEGQFDPVLYKLLKIKEKIMFARFFKDESGATAIEYGLIAAATGLALVATMPAINTALNTTFGSISAEL